MALVFVWGFFFFIFGDFLAGAFEGNTFYYSLKDLSGRAGSVTFLMQLDFRGLFQP